MAETGKLEVNAVGDRDVVITRSFDAPRSLVFECWTKPELIRRWLFGPPGWTMTECSIDPRPGGRYRYAWEGPEGKLGLTGRIREIVRPEKIGSAEIYDDDWTGGETHSTIVFTETAGRTDMRQTVRYSSAKAREGALATGMTEGMGASFKNLNDLAVGLAAERV